MTFDVPGASYYGALITNDSFEVLVRKNANAGEGLFLRWPHDSDIRPDLLVQSCLDKEFGVSAKLIEGYDGIVFINNGSLANFIMHYLGGDIEVVGLKWVSLETAWEHVFELGDHKVLLSDSASLGILDRWIRNRRRQIVEEAIDGEKKEWFDKFDRLCERVRAVLGSDSFCYRGDIGLYSEYIQSVISSTAARMKAMDDLKLYLIGLFKKANQPGRSAAREKALIEAIHMSLTLSCGRLYAGKYADHARECRRTLRFLAALGEIYDRGSLEIRRRAIKGGYARWQGHAKADQIKEIESVILKVLQKKELYRRTDRADVIASKIVNIVLGEMSSLGLSGVGVAKNFHLFIWNFITENKAARKLLNEDKDGV